MLVAKANTTSELVADISERIASTLNVGSKCVRLDRWRFSGELPSILHCRGSSAGRRFFAKIFLADPYPVGPRVDAPWEDTLPPSQQFRAVEEQIEAEWNMTNELRLVAGPGYIPAPLAKSKTAKTIVWEEVTGIRLDHLVARSRWTDPKGKASAAALFQAGAWLKRVHDASSHGNVTVEIVDVIEIMRGLVEREGLRSSRYALIALQLLETARMSIGGEGKLQVLVALNHGDFLLPNLMWDKKLSRVFVFDFEHSGYRGICHDLVSMIFSLRVRLLNPLVPKLVILSSEKSFWTGYGSIPREMSIFVNAMASAWIFYNYLPRLSTLKKRRGWLAGVKASIYKAFFEDFVITQRLGISSSA